MTPLRPLLLASQQRRQSQKDLSGSRWGLANNLSSPLPHAMWSPPAAMP